MFEKTCSDRQKPTVLRFDLLLYFFLVIYSCYFINLPVFIWFYWLLKNTWDSDTRLDHNKLYPTVKKEQIERNAVIFYILV